MTTPTPDREALARMPPELITRLEELAKALERFVRGQQPFGYGDKEVAALDAKAIRSALTVVSKADQWLARSSGGGEAIAALQTEVAKMDPEWPNYADWDIGLPAGHWRAILDALPPPAPSGVGEQPDTRYRDCANPFYTPRIVAAFRAYKEADYGGKLPDEMFKLGGPGKYSEEPYYTEQALAFRLFKAGAEYLESCLSAAAAPAPLPSGVVELKEALISIRDGYLVNHTSKYARDIARAAIAAVPMEGKSNGG